MQKGFFTQLFGFIDNYDIKLSLVKNESEMTVMLTPILKENIEKNNNKSLDNSEGAKNLPAFTVIGTPEELDQDFFKHCSEAFDTINTSISNVNNYNKRFNEWLKEWNGLNGTELEKLRYKYYLIKGENAKASWKEDKLNEEISLLEKDKKNNGLTLFGGKSSSVASIIEQKDNDSDIAKKKEQEIKTSNKPTDSILQEGKVITGPINFQSESNTESTSKDIDSTAKIEEKDDEDDNW